MSLRTGFVLAASALVSVGAVAQDFAAFKMSVIGNFGNQAQSTQVERPFFEKLKADSGGRVDVSFRTIDELGLKGFEAMRLLSQGSFDLMAMQLGYVSGDAPFVLGIDMPGIAPDLRTAKAMAEAYKDPMDRFLQEKFKGRLLTLWPYPGQIFFCKRPIAGIDDLRGKKIRVYSPALSRVVEQLGGAGVTVPFPEVYQALQRGVVDCAISGSTGGNAQKWYEVSTHLYPLSVGWGFVAHVANADFMAKLNPNARAYLLEQMRKLESEFWELAARTDDDAISCNTGGACRFGTQGKMTLVPVTDADKARIRRIAEQAVLPAWASDCTKTFPACKAQWNESIGKVIGFRLD